MSVFLLFGLSESLMRSRTMGRFLGDLRGPGLSVRSILLLGFFALFALGGELTLELKFVDDFSWFTDLFVKGLGFIPDLGGFATDNGMFGFGIGLDLKNVCCLKGCCTLLELALKNERIEKLPAFAFGGLFALVGLFAFVLMVGFVFGEAFFLENWNLWVLVSLFLVLECFSHQLEDCSVWKRQLVVPFLLLLWIWKIFYVICGLCRQLFGSSFFSVWKIQTLLRCSQILLLGSFLSTIHWLFLVLHFCKDQKDRLNFSAQLFIGGWLH